MAKKKTAETANIKSAPVLRAQSGGEQPTPTPEQTGTRTYQIMDPWKDRDVVNLVDVKAVDGEITEVKVNGQPAGGGGGVGKELKINVTGNDPNGACYVSIHLFNTPTNIQALSINSEHNYGFGDQGKIEIGVPDEYTDVLMLKDGIHMDIVTAEGFTYTVTGDARPTIQNSYKVFGNCTVTFTAN